MSFPDPTATHEAVLGTPPDDESRPQVKVTRSSSVAGGGRADRHADSLFTPLASTLWTSRVQADPIRWASALSSRRLSVVVPPRMNMMKPALIGTAMSARIATAAMTSMRVNPPSERLRDSR